ncbi:MAG: DUF1648 domain-containing protein [Candidatus Krumholzibacteriia bacterium]|nr:DUF1648 domain-containing protein [bacterium]MCB9513976.1 DUF1648 domain-containing protein [Candidatus Latescibacterota bacterium]MCB9517024.1 DUF1648 domain-containing protein [Candidatus Latescibacterota bacterium]
MAPPRRPVLWTLLTPPSLGVLPFVLLVLLWAVALAQFPRLPDLLPTRFIPWGEPVAWSPKSPAYFVLPATGTLILFTLGLLQRLALRHTVVDGRQLHGRAARAVRHVLRRYLFFVKSALMAWFINLEFRITQLAYGTRESLGWDSYLVAGLLVLYVMAGAWIMLRSARRWLAWQDAQAATKA